MFWRGKANKFTESSSFVKKLTQKCSTDLPLFPQTKQFPLAYKLWKINVNKSWNIGGRLNIAKILARSWVARRNVVGRVRTTSHETCITSEWSDKGETYGIFERLWTYPQAWCNKVCLNKFYLKQLIRYSIKRINLVCPTFSFVRVLEGYKKDRLMFYFN